MKRASFERALHRWDKWLESINKGRKALGFPASRPSLQEMRIVAKKFLTELGFPACTLFELYWLCCVLTDYDEGGGLKFNKLVLPDWFPFPFGFRYEKSIPKEFLDLKGRIPPPRVLSEVEAKFWQANTTMARITGKPSDKLPNSEFIMVLPDSHPVRKQVRIGRPIKNKADGKAVLE
jgi:hypothetical protein